MEKEQKKFHKTLISHCIFSIIKNVFHYMIAKFSYLIWMHAISSQQSQILRRMGMSCLFDIGTCSIDFSWLLGWSLILPNNTAAKVFRS